MARPAILIGGMALALAGCAADARRDGDDGARAAREFAAATEGRVAGTPVSCMDVQRTGGPQIISPNTLIYRDGSTLWVTQAEGCPYLDDNDLIVARVFGTQLCRNDQFRTVQRGAANVPGPICRVGNFTPWRKPDR